MASASDLIPSYSFDVSFDGVSFSFSKISNISGSIEYDTIIDGGSNGSPVLLRKPKRSPDMLVLEKGTYTSAKDVLFALLTEGTVITAISISVLRDGKTVRMFFITNGVIVKREYSTMDAGSSGVLLEYLQIAHSGLTEIPLPVGM